MIGGETVNMKKLAPFIRDKLSACVEMREDAGVRFGNLPQDRAGAV